MEKSLRTIRTQKEEQLKVHERYTPNPKHLKTDKKETKSKREKDCWTSYPFKKSPQGKKMLISFVTANSMHHMTEPNSLILLSSPKCSFQEDNICLYNTTFPLPKNAIYLSSTSFSGFFFPQAIRLILHFKVQNEQNLTLLLFTIILLHCLLLILKFDKWNSEYLQMPKIEKQTNKESKTRAYIFANTIQSGGRNCNYTRNTKHRYMPHWYNL